MDIVRDEKYENVHTNSKWIMKMVNSTWKMRSMLREHVPREDRREQSRGRAVRPQGIRAHDCVEWTHPTRATQPREMAAEACVGRPFWIYES